MIRSHTWLAALAAALMLPAALHGPITHDSFVYDLSWTSQFADQLAHGELYPRWLPRSFGGLGAPVFFFYPPLSFYVASAFALIGAPVWLALVAAGWCALFGSGAAMRAWTGSSGAAALYMLAPYHLYDFYIRGDLAEFAAYAWLPLIALAIDRRRWVLLAVCYAGLVCTHLPSAVLASVLMIGPFAVWRRGRAAILGAALGLGAGVCLAAVYLVPAIVLQPYASLQSITWGDLYKASNWAVWNILASPSPIRLAVMMSFALAAAVVALSLRPTFWTVCVLVACACVAGLPIWSLPLFDRMQFPYRALQIVEFATVTALAFQPLPVRRWLLPVPAMLIIAAGVVVYPEPKHPITREADEFLPSGLLREASYRRFSPLPPAIANAPARTAHGTVSTIRAFWFPGWSCEAFPDPATHLVSFHDPTCTPRRIATAPEKAGLAISLAAAAALALGALMRRRTRVGLPPSAPSAPSGS